MPAISQSHDSEAVLEFWLGPLDVDGLADALHSSRWWKKDPDFDQELRQRFAADHARAIDGSLARWTVLPRGRLALILVLDQFSRNMFRGQPEMFAADEQALDVAVAGIDAFEDRSLLTDERVFFYMPLMHSEQLPVQERSVALFQRLASEVSERARERAQNSLSFALAHRDIVGRFGRFPHRNAILGRPSTPEELEFLRQPGSSF